MAKNVLGGDLIPCSMDPLTGFFRNGKCDTRADDQGMHTICVRMTNEFLAYSKSVGNDRSKCTLISASISPKNSLTS